MDICNCKYQGNSLLVDNQSYQINSTTIMMNQSVTILAPGGTHTPPGTHGNVVYCEPIWGTWGGCPHNSNMCNGPCEGKLVWDTRYTDIHTNSVTSLPGRKTPINENKMRNNRNYKKTQRISQYNRRGTSSGNTGYVSPYKGYGGSVSNQITMFGVECENGNDSWSADAPNEGVQSQLFADCLNAGGTPIVII